MVIDPLAVIPRHQGAIGPDSVSGRSIPTEPGSMSVDTTHRTTEEASP
jgi:hypothetical protein